LHLHLDNVPVLQEALGLAEGPNPRRRARHDGRARGDRSAYGPVDNRLARQTDIVILDRGRRTGRLTLAHVAEDGLGRKDHILLKLCGLAHLAVDPRHQRPAAGKHLGTDQRRTDGGELVERLGEEELAGRVLRELEEPAGQVVADGVA